MLARPAFDGLEELRVRMCTTTTSAVERACFVEAFPDLLPLLESRDGTKIVLETRTDLPVWVSHGVGAGGEVEGWACCSAAVTSRGFFLFVYSFFFEPLYYVFVFLR